MTYGTSAATTSAAAAEARRRAVTAMGLIVRVDSERFLDVLAKSQNPLVLMTPTIVMTWQGWRPGIGHKIRYATSYKGFLFVTDAATLLDLPEGVEVLAAEKINLP